MNVDDALVASLRDRVLALARGRDRVIVGVVGEPGSGKSTLTHALAALLEQGGVSTVVVVAIGDAIVELLALEDTVGTVKDASRAMLGCLP